jgi:hypothetical protein
MLRRLPEFSLQFVNLFFISRCPHLLNTTIHLRIRRGLFFRSSSHRVVNTRSAGGSFHSVVPKSTRSDPLSQPRGVRCHSVHSLLNDIATQFNDEHRSRSTSLALDLHRETNGTGTVGGDSKLKVDQLVERKKQLMRMNLDMRFLLVFKELVYLD